MIVIFVFLPFSGWTWQCYFSWRRDKGTKGSRDTIESHQKVSMWWCLFVSERVVLFIFSGDGVAQTADQPPSVWSKTKLQRIKQKMFCQTSSECVLSGRFIRSSVVIKSNLRLWPGPHYQRLRPCSPRQWQRWRQCLHRPQPPRLGPRPHPLKHRLRSHPIKVKAEANSLYSDVIYSAIDLSLGN